MVNKSSGVVRGVSEGKSKNSKRKGEKVINYIKLVPVIVAIIKALADGKLSKEELINILTMIAGMIETEKK